MMRQARCSFEVQLPPQTLHKTIPDTSLGRLSMAKEFRGDLTGTSAGEVLTAGTGIKGSAGYVAVELVNGTLDRKRGPFVLQHSGSMHRGAGDLSVTVVPDSVSWQDSAAQ